MPTHNADHDVASVVKELAVVANTLGGPTVRLRGYSTRIVILLVEGS